MHQHQSPLPDPDWTWEENDKRHWEDKAGSLWQEFCQRWRNSPASSRFLEGFPYVLELGMNQGSPLLPFHASTTSKNRILVVKSYDDMYNRILQLRQVDSGAKRGVVLTGQPGTGASL